MWVILMADCLFRACDFCPRNSHQWGQNRSYHKVANPEKHYRGLKFAGIHGILLSVFPKFMQVAWSLTWVNFRWKCWKEEGCHSVGQQVPTGLWWPEKTVYHHAYSCLCGFHPAFQAPHWYLWVWLGSCSLPDPWGWHRHCNSLCQ